MATGELNQQPQDQFSHADPKPETGNPGPPPRLPIWSSLRTRLLVSLLGLVIIAVLAVGYMGVNSVQSMGESAQQVSGEALRVQAEEYLNQLTVGEAQQNNLILKRVQRDAENVAHYAAGHGYGSTDAHHGGRSEQSTERLMRLRSDGHRDRIGGRGRIRPPIAREKAVRI